MKNCAKSITVDESRESYICSQLFQWKDLGNRHTYVDLLELAALGRCIYNSYFKRHLDSKWDYLLLCLACVEYMKAFTLLTPKSYLCNETVGPSLSPSPSEWLQPAENKIYTLAKMEKIPLFWFLPSSICTCKLLAFNCNKEVTQMVIIQRKIFAFCKKPSSLEKLWLDFCKAFLSPVTYWQRKLKRVSPFPGKQSRDQLLGLGGLGAFDSYPVVAGKGGGGKSWGHRCILIFLVLCFTVFISVLYKVTVSGKKLLMQKLLLLASRSFGVTFFVVFFSTTFSLFFSAIVPGKSRMLYILIPLAFLSFFGNH